MKNYNIMIDGENFFDQPFVTGQGDDFITGCLLDDPYFKENYKTVKVDSSKQQALDADPRAILKINFIGNSDQAEGAIMFFILEEAKEIILDF